MIKKRGRPPFPTAHRTLNVYLPNDLHDLLAARAQKLGVSRSRLIRVYVGSALDGARISDLISTKQAKVYGK